MKEGTYEPSCMELIKLFSEAGFSYVDVGANIGLHLQCACEYSRNPLAFFHGFEPEPRMFEVLSKNCERFVNKNVHLHPKAVGAEIGKANLFVSTTWNQGNHSLCPRLGNDYSISCDVTTLDSELSCIEKPLDKTFIKIDVEGSEIDVLLGSRQFISHIENLAILCEASQENLSRAGYSLSDLVETFRSCGLTRGYEVRDDRVGLIPWSLDSGFRGSMTNVLLLRGIEAFRAARVASVVSPKFLSNDRPCR
jgi:FkbM family methyltransferase